MQKNDKKKIAQQLEKNIQKKHTMQADLAAGLASSLCEEFFAVFVAERKYPEHVQRKKISSTIKK